jgi:O-antigen ligase
MPEHLKAIIVVLFLATGVFWFARRALCDELISEQDYLRRRNTWFALTLILFLAHNYWLYVVASAGLLAVMARRDANAVAFIFGVLFAAPPLRTVVPGVGPIETILEIDFYRSLSLFVLLPVALLRRVPRAEHRALRPVDVVVAAFVAWQFLREAPTSSLIESSRRAVLLLIDIWLPYFVASRALQSRQQIRDALATAILMLSIVGTIALFEFARRWQLYESLWSPLGLQLPPFTAYQARAGWLRANVTSGSPIVLGYLLQVGIGFLFCVLPWIRSRAHRVLAIVALIGGLLATLARGPWVGVLISAVAFVCLQPHVLRRMIKPALGIAAAVTIVAISPVGQFLPFIGTVDTGSIDYRSRLFDVSMQVFWQHPLVGDPDFLYNPTMEQMRQGQGLIDMVNTYLQVALPYGFIGFALFLACFALPLRRLNRLRLACAARDPEGERLARGLIATLIGVMFTIGTVSSINAIPYLYWWLIGMCVGYVSVLSSTDASVQAERPDEVHARVVTALPPRPIRH